MPNRLFALLVLVWWIGFDWKDLLGAQELHCIGLIYAGALEITIWEHLHDNKKQPASQYHEHLYANEKHYYPKSSYMDAIINATSTFLLFSPPQHKVRMSRLPNTHQMPGPHKWDTI